MDGNGNFFVSYSATAEPPPGPVVQYTVKTDAMALVVTAGGALGPKVNP